VGFHSIEPKNSAKVTFVSAKNRHASPKTTTIIVTVVAMEKSAQHTSPAKISDSRTRMTVRLRSRADFATAETMVPTLGDGTEAIKILECSRVGTPAAHQRASLLRYFESYKCSAVKISASEPSGLLPSSSR
jgi:hypothetical protein